MGRRTEMRLLAAALPVLLAAGCGGGREEAGAEAAYRREINTGSGLGSLVVLLDRTAITTADAVRLELVAEGPAGMAVGFPEVGKRWGGWTVADVSQVERSVVAGGGVRTRRAYVLEPYLAGDYEVPKFVVRMGGGGIGEEEVKVEAVPVVVASLLDGDSENGELGEPYGDVEAEGEGSWGWAAAGVGLLVLGAVAFWVVLGRRGKRGGVGVDEVGLVLGELDGMLGSGEIEAARLGALGRRVGGLPGELAGRIEELAYSRVEASDAALRAAAEELREKLVGERGCGG